MNKRILISQKDLKEFTSGVPRKVLSEVKLFRRMGYKPIVIAETIDKQIIKAAGGFCIKTWRWPFSGKMRRTFYLKQVEKKIKKLSPDLVLGHGDIIEQDILYLHNCVHFSYERQNSKQLPSSNDIGQLHSEILKANKFKLLICNSKLMQRDLITRFNLDESKTAVVYPEYNQIQFNTCHHIYNANNALLKDIQIGATLNKQQEFDLRNLPVTYLICYFNGFEEAITKLEGSKPYLKNYSNEVYKLYKEAVRVLRKIKYN